MAIKTHHIVGLDVGQAADFSAAALVQYADGSKPTFSVPLLKRWPLSTSYREVGRSVARLLSEPDLSDATLVLDQTGVGAAVGAMILEELAAAHVPAQVVRVTITGGNTVSYADAATTTSASESS